MNHYIVGFDLLAESHDYEPLFETLCQYDDSASFTERLWGVVTYKSLTEVGDDIAERLADGDRLFVAESGFDAVTYNVFPASEQWMLWFLEGNPLRNQYDAQQAYCESLDAEHAELKAYCESLDAEHAELQSRYDRLQADYEYLGDKFDEQVEGLKRWCANNDVDYRIERIQKRR